MEKILEKLIDILELSPRFFFLPIMLVTAFALFAPDTWLDFFAVMTLVSQNRSLLGVAFLVSAIFVLVSAGHSLYSWSKNTIESRQKHTRRLESTRKRLHNLTEDEKDLLRRYTQNGTRTQYFPIGDGVVRGLEVAGIIYIPGGSMVGSLLTGVAYNLKDVAWDYLQKHPEVLDSARGVEERIYEPRYLHRW